MCNVIVDDKTRSFFSPPSRVFPLREMKKFLSEKERSRDAWRGSEGESRGEIEQDIISAAAASQPE